MSRPDHLISQALHGRSLESEAHRVRAEEEQKVQASHEAVDECAMQVTLGRTGVASAQDAMGTDGDRGDALIAEAKVALSESRRKVEDAEATQDAQETRHGQTGKPTLPKAAENVLQFSAAGLVEACASATFFIATGVAPNLAVALSLGIGIAAANLAFSALGGFFPGRHLDYGKDSEDPDEPEFARVRRRARFQLLLCIVALALLHETAGLVRAQETISELDRSLSAHLAMFADAGAVLLIAIGVSISVFTFHRARTAFDSSYPGMAELERAVQEARAEHETVYAYYEAQIDAFMDGRREKLRTHEAGIVQRYRGLNDAIASHGRAVRMLAQTIQQAETAVRNEIKNLDKLPKPTRGRPKKGATKVDLSALVDFSRWAIEETFEFVGSPDFTDAHASLDALDAELRARLVALLSLNDDEE